MSKIDPIANPLQLRDAIADDYRRSYARMGVHDVSHEAFQKLAAYDLALVDHVDTVGVTPNRSQKNLVRPDQGDAPSKAQVMAGDVRGRMVTREVKDTPIVRPRKAMQELIGERHTALMRRLSAMLKVEPSLKRHQSLADRPYLYPDLAKDVLSAHSDFTLRRRGYRFLADKDCYRMFWRTIEDIADRSTGRLGQWWVPK